MSVASLIAAVILAFVPAPASAWCPAATPKALVIVRRLDTGTYHLVEIGDLGTALRHSVAIPLKAVTDPETNVVNWWGVHCQPLCPRGRPWPPSRFTIIYTFGAGAV